MIGTEWVDSVQTFSLSLCPVENHVKARNEIKTKEMDGYNDDVSFYNVHSDPVLECDYDRGAHALYDAIEKKRWGDADRIFCESKLEADTVEPEPSKCQSSSKGCLSRAEVLAKTWVYRTYPNSNGRIKWRITALHAAVIFDAPPDQFRNILEAHPASAKLRDDRGNLPIHLAFKTGLDEGRINILLDAYRGGLEVKNNKGLTPMDCVAFCRNEERRMPILTFVGTNKHLTKGNDSDEIICHGKRLGISLKTTGALEEELPKDETSTLSAEARDSEQKLLENEGGLEEELEDLHENSEETKDEIEDTTDVTGLPPQIARGSKEANGENENKVYNSGLSLELVKRSEEAAKGKSDNNAGDTGLRHALLTEELSAFTNCTLNMEADLPSSDLFPKPPLVASLTREQANSSPASGLKAVLSNKATLRKGRSAIGKIFTSKSRKKEKRNRQQQQTPVSQNAGVNVSSVVDQCDGSVGGGKEVNRGSQQQRHDIVPIVEEHASSVASDVLTEEVKQVLSNDQEIYHVDDSDGEAGGVVADSEGNNEMVREQELVHEMPSILQQLSVIKECSPSMEQSSVTGIELNKGESVAYLEAIGIGPTLLDKHSDLREAETSACDKGATMLDGKRVTTSYSCDKSSNRVANSGKNNTHGIGRDNSILSQSLQGAIIKNVSEEQDVLKGTQNYAVALALSHSMSTEDNPPLTVVSSTTYGESDTVASDMSPISTDTERMMKYYHRHYPQSSSRFGCGGCWGD
eukprot:CAMPEP_0113542168 /NCGR_PEP_ID=MMETSP0015_2-20120614/9452_1 /TAXON_ID=2838 /ORGANISM="Odontella" /LENGTH=748 /DNA_ID=CAMNT_0000442185 /DNA_START=370 /DNA_END=2616 /DNA_ORIENTATION=- /assembly_acc=CAM_ASM_000160